MCLYIHTHTHALIHTHTGMCTYIHTYKISELVGMLHVTDAAGSDLVLRGFRLVVLRMQLSSGD